MLSFNKINDASKSISIIYDIEKKKNKSTVYLNEVSREKLERDKNFDSKLDKYFEEVYIDDNDESNVRDLVLKKKYEFKPVPSNATKDNMRFVNFIVGKSGSGKSYYTSSYLEKYHYMYPENKIFYVSNNPIENDTSYNDKLKKFITQIDLNTINSVIDFTNFKECIFVFDDIIDCEIALDPNVITQQLMAEKEAATNRKVMKLDLKDTVAVSRYIKIKSALVKKYIVDSILNLLNLGRKNQISVLVTDHKLFSGSYSSKIISEAHNIVLFPYGNVSKNKLNDFLMQKLSFDKDQSKEISDTKYYQYDFLNIGVSGANYYMTKEKISLL